MTRVGKRAERVCTEAHYQICAICALTQEVALEACHINNEPSDDNPDNLVWLCRTHHRMMDCGMYPGDIVKALRDHWNDWFGNNRQPDHKRWVKDAGEKAATTRRRSTAARRAWATRNSQNSLLPAVSDPALSDTD